MGPLVFQGRPFFVVGTYNPPDDEDLQEWLVAGCNTAVLNTPATDPSVAAANAQVAQWLARYDIAAVYFPGVDVSAGQKVRRMSGRWKSAAPYNLSGRRAF